jgi:hypothetical protein
MKNLILDITNYTNQNQKFFFTQNIKQYATKYNLNFHQADVNEFINLDFGYFNKFDNICLISSFLLFRDDCPNVFEISLDKISILNESIYRVNLLKMNQLQKSLNISEVTYYNTDLVIIPKKFIFEIISGIFGQQTNEFINVFCNKNKKDIFELPNEFNRTHFMDSKIGTDRHSAYIINYMEAPDELVLSTALKDKELWSRSDYSLFDKKTFVLSMSAGMGDQVEAEPVARYMIEKMYPDDNFVIVTHHPRLFEHLARKNVIVTDYSEYKGTEHASVVLRNCPDDSNNTTNLSHVYFHPTDFASIQMIKRILPISDRTIRQVYYPTDKKNVLKIADENQLLKSVVIHAGRWWPSKTFPFQWWQSVIDILKEKNISVILIGKTLDDLQGVHDIVFNGPGYDFRNKTTLGELLYILDKCPVLVSNDSSPIHLAGAFDNQIITIATCKHPEHILPYRNGSQFYKCKSVEKKLMIDDMNLNDLDLCKIDRIDEIPRGHDILEYLPSPYKFSTLIIETLQKEINERKN